jgi:thioredoxin-related protein
MKQILLFVTIISFFAFTKTSTAAEINFIPGTYSEILAKAKAENKIVMIDFITDWCKWCIELDRKVYTDPEVFDYANANQINWKIDAEKGEGIELAKKYNVKGYPTIIFANSDGIEIDRIYGYYPVKDFLKMMKDYNAGINTYTSLKAEVESNPNDAAANYKFAEKMIANGEREGAEIYLTKAISLDPDNSSGYTDDAVITLAYLKEDINGLSEAINKYSSSDKIVDAHIYIASLYSSQDRPQEAETVYKNAFSLYGIDNEDLRFNYGNYLVGKAYGISKNENFDNAMLQEGILIANEAIEYVKGSVNEASANYILSEIYIRLNDKENALKSIDRSIEIYDKKSYRDQKEKILNMTSQ